MKTLALLLVVPMFTLCLNVGCAREVSHSESTSPNWTGGQTTKEQTTVQNPDGSISTEQSKTVTH